MLLSFQDVQVHPSPHRFLFSIKMFSSLTAAHSFHIYKSLKDGCCCSKIHHVEPWTEHFGFCHSISKKKKIWQTEQEAGWETEALAHTVATYQIQGSHALKHTLLYCLCCCKWDHNSHNEHWAVSKGYFDNLIRKNFSFGVINKVRSTVIFSLTIQSVFLFNEKSCWLLDGM